MDEYRRRLDQLETAWTELHAADTRQQEFWADSLGDLLESRYVNQLDAERVAISEAGAHYELPYLTLEPLAAHVHVFEPLLLQYVLFSVSATHDKRALRTIEPFRGSSIRLAIAEG